MFTLYVSHLVAEQTAGTFAIDRDRFLEYTDDEFRIPLRGLSSEAKDCLKSWPCLLMQEGRGDEMARIAEVIEISRTTAEVMATIRGLSEPIEVQNKVLWGLKAELDMEQFEFSRNHWAVKERDLFAVLEKAGVHIGPAARERFKPKSVPVAIRSDMLAARDAIAVLGHTQIDDLLLEAGVKKLSAGRELGGRRDRANAIVQFALENPEAVTAGDLSLLRSFLTDDDVGGIKGEVPRPRARQNVILELGYFLAYLGQAKVCALKTPGLEPPSDFDGIVYISMGADQRWKSDLLRELHAAGMPVTVTALK